MTNSFPHAKIIHRISFASYETKGHLLNAKNEQLFPKLLSLIFCSFISDVIDEMFQLKENQKRLQIELSNKRGQIDNLSSQMASLARYHNGLQSKNNELNESIHRISQCINHLKAV